MRPPFKSTWKVYLPGLFATGMIMLVVYFGRTRASAVKYGHDFVPIYSEDGKLEGFTHPVLVNAGNTYREREKEK
ncbi:hypothetical protein AGDE_00876 [Angomonas deanei]|uniref:Uncharacterized protein n=1 Tax=Angomonas deanei TaxID=59799 RepID=S9VJR1_9TRYP|nr:hypothetical protein AGDE_01035 [Angomonas deanei]EPY43047.1 hypothetical protein AGDE_00876 [Angomonas deanei]CAD2219061.1 hypothetical protein, conserved [Angomonas deanei]|eukprot:EPY42888.1 hypothetical protein AGDE_01035 [Angomonas deanei]